LNEGQADIRGASPEVNWSIENNSMSQNETYNNTAKKLAASNIKHASSMESPLDPDSPVRGFGDSDEIKGSN